MDVPLELVSGFLMITLLESILAIDNLLFIYIVTAKLPQPIQKKAQILAIILAALMRIIGLFFIGYLMQLTDGLFRVFTHEISIRDLILIFGGAFLIIKALHEVYLLFFPENQNRQAIAKTLASAVLQIILIDVVFSLDSIITAIGLVDNLWVISLSIIVSCVLMLITAKYLAPLAKEVNFKLLALCFLLLIGVIIIASGIDITINKGYIYSAFGFALSVQVLQLLYKKHLSR
ncbi:TerC family protein [Thiotrichales bacterium 19S3-7]|nr:TerC family protein [Thiotrichales bacterium 19S3-7]MCF6800606.1 TerC family protein [Thiotrichales bacterium 19S3-11]